jgi:hypothetical protein
MANGMANIMKAHNLPVVLIFQVLLSQEAGFNFLLYQFRLTSSFPLSYNSKVSEVNSRKQQIQAQPKPASQEECTGDRPAAEAGSEQPTPGTTELQPDGLSYRYINVVCNEHAVGADGMKHFDLLKRNSKTTHPA